MRNRLYGILRHVIADQAAEDGIQVDLAADVVLLGQGSELDSLSVVMLLTRYEGLVNDAWGVEIVLADDRAMAMEQSPFRSASRVVDYTVLLLEEAHAV